MCGPEGHLNFAKQILTNTCDESVRDANCEEYWTENEIPVEMRRNCAEGAVNVSSSEWIAHCREGYFKSWADYGKALVDGPRSLWKAMFGPEGDQQKALRLCNEDPSLECKRAFALEAGINPSDNVLKAKDASYWQGLAEKHERASRRRDTIKAQADFFALPIEDKRRLLDQKNREMSQMLVSKSFIERVLENTGVRIACYNETQEFGIALLWNRTCSRSNVGGCRRA